MLTNKIKTKIKLRRMGYLKDQNGILKRYSVEKENWQTHIENSKKCILKSSENKDKGKVVVLGSGWILDLPIAELSKIFTEVVLIDIHHPKQILNRYRKFDNISFLEKDITGGYIDFLYENLKKNSTQIQLIPSFKETNFNILENADFVISLNIMVQLHVLLIDYIKKVNPKSVLDQLVFQKTIQQHHIELLPQGKTCLISDFEEELLDKNDHVIGVNPLIHVDLPEGNFSRQWRWKFDTRMTYRDKAKTFFNTKAIDF